MNNRIIIWGNDNYNVLGLARLLSCYNNTTFLLMGRRQFCATLSKYCKKYVFVANIEEGLAYLNNMMQEPLKPIIIPTSDLVAECLDENKEKLKEKYLFSFTRETKLSYYLDKQNMSDLAYECGLKIPLSYRLSQDLDANQVGFPCIIKPAKKRKGFISAFKIEKCLNAVELELTKNKISNPDNYVIQKFIDKEYDYLVYGCRFLDGTVLMPCFFKKTRWVNGDGSYGLLSPIVPDCINTGSIKRFFEKIDYYGLFSIEFGIVNGEAYFYEANFRNDGTSHYFGQAGINIPKIWVDNLADGLTPSCNISFRETFFIDEVYDIYNVRNGKISYTEWKEDKTTARAYKYDYLNDHKPFYYQVLFKYAYKIYSALKKLRK